MYNAPKTIEEARARRYGAWSGNPDGHAYDESQCAEEVSSHDGRMTNYYQCQRKPGHGPGGLYCKAHAKQYAGASMTWWYLSRHLSMPTPKRIQSYTDKTVMVNSSRELRHTEWGDWFSTFAEAKERAISKAQSAVERAEDAVIRTRRELAEIEAWTEPAPQEATDAP